LKLLLDTHVLLWALGEPAMLAEEARTAILNPENDVVASAATAWEIAIKQSLGKLELPGPAESWLPRALERAGFGWIPVTAKDALRVGALPWHHRDPFDRMLVAQTYCGYTLVTRDERIQPYGVPVLWA
jgi:PIN domain nuclease of toxin-antitoxin system